MQKAWAERNISSHAETQSTSYSHKVGFFNFIKWNMLLKWTAIWKKFVTLYHSCTCLHTEVEHKDTAMRATWKAVTCQTAKFLIGYCLALIYARTKHLTTLQSNCWSQIHFPVPHTYCDMWWSFFFLWK
jgi:hypothetical protein